MNPIWPAIGYSALSLLNQGASLTQYKHFSKLEAAGIAASVLAGIDAIVTPAITEGQTLQSILGITPKESTEIVLRFGEKVTTTVLIMRITI